MSEKISNPSIIFVGPLPPPVNGQAKITGKVWETLTSVTDVKTFRIVPRITAYPTALHVLRKSLVILRAIVGLTINSMKPVRRLYLTGDGGSGLFFTALLVFFGVLTRHQIFLHHHTFSYIDEFRRPMKSIIDIAGNRMTNVFLSSSMRDRFENQYGPVKSLIVSNAMHASSQDVDVRQLTPGRPLTIGLLSNLGVAKGLYQFLDLLSACRDKGLQVKGILAGPSENEKAEAAINGALEHLPGTLDYRGPVYGDDKAQFFVDVDVFVFPTTYKTEAQPMVLFEAMSFACAIIVFDRGCIASDLDKTGNRIIPQKADFTSVALDQIANWISNPDELTKTQADSLGAFTSNQSESSRNFGALISALSCKV